MKTVGNKAAAAAPVKKEMKAMKSTASVTHLSNMKVCGETHIHTRLISDIIILSKTNLDVYDC